MATKKEQKMLKLLDVKVWVQDTPRVAIKGMPKATKSTGHFESKKAVLVEGLAAELQNSVKYQEHWEDSWSECVDWVLARLGVAKEKGETEQ